MTSTALTAAVTTTPTSVASTPITTAERRRVNASTPVAIKATPQLAAIAGAIRNMAAMIAATGAHVPRLAGLLISTTSQTRRPANASAFTPTGMSTARPAKRIHVDPRRTTCSPQCLLDNDHTQGPT